LEIRGSTPLGDAKFQGVITPPSGDKTHQKI